MTNKKRTHGKWNPEQERTIFLAGSTFSKNTTKDTLTVGGDEQNQRALQKVIEQQRSVNKLYSLRDFSESNYKAQLDCEIRAYGTILLDSGIFGLAMDYAKESGLSHNLALTTPLKSIPKWPQFRDLYIDMMRHVKDTVWGYVELDLGGTAQKIETRTWLESIGLAPIPVWHPLGDGLDYGKHLMQTYDRICLGNVVKSDRATRNILLQAMTFARQGTKVWVHALGLGPTEFVTAYHVDSLDAMSWMGALMWSRRTGHSLMYPFTREGRYYDEEIDGSKHWIASAMLERQTLSIEQNWRNYEQSKRALILDSGSVCDGNMGGVPSMASGRRKGRVPR